MVMTRFKFRYAGIYHTIDKDDEGGYHFWVETSKYIEGMTDDEVWEIFEGKNIIEIDRMMAERYARSAYIEFYETVKNLKTGEW
jgi:hypothetical protein